MKTNNINKTNNYKMRNFDHIEKQGRKQREHFPVISNEDMFRLNCARYMFNQTNLH